MGRRWWQLERFFNTLDHYIRRITFHTSAPSVNDDVFFDANSFSGTGQNVTVDVDIFAANLDFTGSQMPDCGWWRYPYDYSR